MQNQLKLSACVAALIVSGGTLVQAGTGRIVVANDEWTLGNTGFTNAGSPNASNFAKSVASWFTGGGSGDFLAFSNNFGLTQSSLATAMTTGTGHTWTVGTGGPFNAAYLLANYDAVFVSGATPIAQATVQAELIAYVNGGGSVYLAGGTAAFAGGAAGEATAWNTFLGAFDMSFASTYNSVTGNINVSSNPHPIFNGVNQLWQDNGSSIINVTGPNAQVLVSQGGHGLYAVYDAVVIPLPTAGAMGLAGLGLIGVRRRRVV